MLFMKKKYIKYRKIGNKSSVDEFFNEKYINKNAEKIPAKNIKNEDMTTLRTFFTLSCSNE